MKTIKEKSSHEKPLAYFITFRTYGTWLHGDERQSVDRARNKYDTPKINPNKNLKKQMEMQQKFPSVLLTEQHGDIILNSFVHASNQHDWKLNSLHIRTNHIHTTILADEKPETVMTKLKTVATHFLRKQNHFPQHQPIWSRGGSTKYLWTPESLYFASEYTLERQGQKMVYYFNPV